MGQWMMNETSFICPKEINSYITNLTSSYTEKSNEPNMVAASVIMFVLAGLFFNLNLFSGISDVSAILDPKVRLFLYSALSLFLPVMSYLFSEAKNAGGAAVAATTTTTAHAAAADLSLRAGLILAWMLLVELLRKKVDEIRMRGYSGTIQRAGRVVWLGNLVFFNIRTAGRKAVFSVLWILCATKVLQRIAFTEVGKRSYAHGKNARLISSYMSQILPLDDHRSHQEMITGKELLKTCDYIVMGEENLEDIEPTADGYKLLEEDNKSTTTSDAADDNNNTNKLRKFLKDRGIVTVGEVWQLVEGSKLFTSPEQTESLRRICLSFALFKLLRRRFEHLPAMTDKEVRDSRDLILRGLYRHSKDGDDDNSCSPEAVFQVMNDEINFLSEYYHSVIPVVLASPFFLFINYILLTVSVAVLCLMTIILCGNGDVMYAFHSIAADNYTLQSGLSKIAICLVIRATKSPAAFFSIVDLSITGLLFVIFFYEEIWEFLVFVLSNWFMVSLLYNYILYWRDSPNPTTFPFALRGIIWLRSKMSHRRLSMKQFSVLNLRWPLKVPLFATFTSMAVRTEVVPRKVMEDIMKYLDLDATQAIVPTKGMSALGRHQDLPLHELSWACQSNSVAEVILTWHIATSIMEVEGVAPQNDSVEVASSKVAIRLSKYCAYLVAFHPELLPDNPEKAERVFEDMKVELRDMIGYWHYYVLSQRRRAKKIFQVKDQEMITPPGGDHMKSDDRKYRVIHDGVNLARSLMKFQAKRWKVLADVWNELIIYVAPSSDEERVRGHEDVLVQGGEFITVLWALTTHIGVSRKPRQTAGSNDAARMAAAAAVVHLDV